MIPSRVAAPRLDTHHTHRNVAGGSLRPAAFGAMDGLVSNFALLAGVAGAQAAPHALVVTGLAGLAAGACSMGMGEYTSVRSQAEAIEAEIAIERREIANRPKAEEAELAMLYRRRGLSVQLAAEVAAALSRNTDEVWRIHAREELGIDPDALPSPYVAAISSFLSFALGATLPVLPYAAGARTLLPSLIVAAVGLFLLGALLARFTARSFLWSGLRQLGLGAVAAAITFGIGHAVGQGL